MPRRCPHQPRKRQRCSMSASSPRGRRGQADTIRRLIHWPDDHDVSARRPCATVALHARVDQTAGSRGRPGALVSGRVARRRWPLHLGTTRRTPPSLPSDLRLRHRAAPRHVPRSDSDAARPRTRSGAGRGRSQLHHVYPTDRCSNGPGHAAMVSPTRPARSADALIQAGLGGAILVSERPAEEVRRRRIALTYPSFGPLRTLEEPVLEAQEAAPAASPDSELLAHFKSVECQ